LFETLRAWFDRRRTLREARAGGLEDNHPYSAFFAEQIATARAEFGAGRRDRAWVIWREMHVRFPDLCMRSAKALNLLIELGHHDEADALILEGRRRYPRYKAMHAAAFARVAYHRGNLEESLSRCESLRHDFPREADGYTIAAECLVAHGRLDEAEAMIGHGVSKVPGDVDMAVLYARHAMRREARPEALRRWYLVRDRFKEHCVGSVGAAECLRSMGRCDDAEHLLATARERFEKDPWPIVELANLAAAKGDHARAVEHWEFLIEHFRSFDHAYRMGVVAMRNAGQEAKADELYRIMAVRAPYDLPAQLEYARSGDRCGHPRAAERWAAIREEFPECAEAREREVEPSVAIGDKGGVP
jgi:tetratricopeptide (TPR) repeat protein